MRALRAQAVEKAESIIQQLALPPGCALVATGSLARREMTPYSDIDLLLLHPAGTKPDNLDQLWYPIWDAKIRLDYAVRTPEECISLLSNEPTAALAMLDMRHVAGDTALSEHTISMVRNQWRRVLPSKFDQITDVAITRWRHAGSMVTMTKPDLKHGRGGLRDLDLIEALAIGNLCDLPDLRAERDFLLDVRTCLHQHAGRARDILDPEFALNIASDFGLDDRYELSRTLARTARTVDDALSQSLQTARDLLPKRSHTLREVRRPVDVDVVASSRQLELARNAKLQDPSLALRIAAASARTGLTVSHATWQRLQQLPPMPSPWPKAAVYDFFTLLTDPERTIPELDRYGFWQQIVPVWDEIRGRMPKEPIHIHTIDRHSLVVTANCAEHRVQVARPDLLLLAALFHDIGKGSNGPHEARGAELVTQMARTLRLSEQDIAIVHTLVAQHSLIPQIVRSMDPESDAAVTKLLDAIHYDPLILDLLRHLVRADAQGTGPNVWTPALQYGTRQLCAKARARLHHITPKPPMIPPQTAGIRLQAQSNSYATVYWAGQKLSELHDLLKVIVAKGWNISSAALLAGYRAQLGVYNTLGSGFDEALLIQAWKSKVHQKLPASQHTQVATYWVDNVCEIRTPDQPGALGILLTHLDQIQWLDMQTPGSTMIVHCAFQPGFYRATTERQIIRAFS